METGRGSVPIPHPLGHVERSRFNDAAAFCSARYQPEIIRVHSVAKILLRYERFRPCIIQIFTRRVHVRYKAAPAGGYATTIGSVIHGSRPRSPLPTGRSIFLASSRCSLFSMLRLFVPAVRYLFNRFMLFFAGCTRESEDSS